MNLRPLSRLILLCVVALQADCVLVCNNDSCEPSIDILRSCATSHQCRVNGQVVSSCGIATDCPLYDIKPNNRYEIPVDTLWPTVGTRNDLQFEWWDGNAEEDGDVLVTLDGNPPTDTMCKREFLSNVSRFTCLNLPRSLQRLEFEFIPPPSGVTGDLNMQIYARDDECMEAHAGECD